VAKRAAPQAHREVAARVPLAARVPPGEVVERLEPEPEPAGAASSASGTAKSGGTKAVASTDPKAVAK